VSTPAQNVLLITVDTLRADALGASGNAAAATPRIDRLAGTGVRFASAYAHSPLTLPSHASILTGRLPFEHGVRDNAGFRLRRGTETLATRLHAGGFRTGAFVSGFPLDSRFGLAAGFDVYDDRFVDATPRPLFLEQERRGTETVAAAVRWLTQQAGHRWFCWVHLYEPHFPYTPPAPLAARFAGNPYAGEVAAVDEALAPLLDPVLAEGDAGGTLVVLTADHGESLGEHGEATHGLFAYDSTLQVPLLLYHAASLRPRVVTGPASHVDIVPTVLDILGLPAAASVRGRSLREPALGARNGGEVVYFEALSGSLNRGWAPLTGLIANGMKYIELPIPELYDLRADPGETRNLAPMRSRDVDMRRTLLQSYAGGEVRPADETAEVRERLRALGYASGPPAGRLPADRGEDPKNGMAVDAALQEVARLYAAGDLAGALDHSRTLAAGHPDMRVALLQLSNLEREAGNLPGAIAPLRHALELHPGDEEAASLLGAALTAANRSAEAVRLLEPYAAGPEPDVQVLVAYGLALARAGRFEEAHARLDQARRGDPTNALLAVTAGTIDVMWGHRPDARRAFESALALNPGFARAHSSLGALAEEDGRRHDAIEQWRRAVAIDPGEYEKLLAFAIALAGNGRREAAAAYFQLFAEGAPATRYGDDIARARAWLQHNRQ
jgi:arylsulfatase A-like enzyme/tetratricopeptide (TPR) repeat protein